MDPVRDPNKGILNFLNYNTYNLEFLSTLQEKCKLQYDPATEELSVIGGAIVSGGFSKTSFLGQKFQLGCQIFNRSVHGTINDSVQVQAFIAKQFDVVDDILIKCELSIDALIARDTINPDQIQLLKETWDKLQRLQSTLKTDETVLHQLFDFMSGESKVAQAANSVGCKTYVGTQLKRIHAMTIKLYPLLPKDDLLAFDDDSFEERINKVDVNSSSHIGSLIGFAGSLVNTCFSNTAAFFADRDHFWKQHKWHLFMEQSAKALENEMGMDLNAMIAGLSNCDTADPEHLAFINQVKAVLQILEKAYGKINVSDDRRALNQAHIFALREAIEPQGTDLNDEPKWPPFKKILAIKEKGVLQSKSVAFALNILMTFNYLRFTKMDIYPFCEYIVTKVIDSGKGGLDLSQADELDENMLTETDFKCIDEMDPELGANRAAVNLGKARGTFNIGFDPYTQSNSPYTLGTVNICDKNGKFKPLTIIRMGTPTIDDGILTNSARINPEFIAYLEYCKTNGLKHLYISAQSDLKANEAHRNQLFKDLMKLYPDNFAVVVLDQDSSFYHQKKEFAVAEMPSAEFTQKLVERMLADDCGYYFPENWKTDPEFKKKLSQTIDSTIEVLFGKNKLALSKKERLDIIELAHAFAAWDLISSSGADNVNVSCKDCIDRGMKQLSLMLEILVTAQGESDNPIFTQMIRNYTHAAAIFVKKQAIIDERKDRLVSARNRIIKQDVRDRIINGICPLPINAQEHFNFKIHSGQRPGEQALLNFNEELFQAFAPDIQSILFDQKQFKNLIDLYINNDYFMDFDSSCDLQMALTKSPLYALFVTAAKTISQAELSQKELRQMQQLISEMVYFTLLNPKTQSNPLFKNSAFNCLMAKLNELIVDPRGFLERVHQIKDCNNIFQRNFKYCLLNITEKNIRSEMTSHPLFEEVMNSPYLANLLNISTDLKLEDMQLPAFKSFKEITHPLEMIILGQVVLREFMVDLKTTLSAEQDSKRKHLFLQTTGIMQTMERFLKELSGAKNPENAAEILKKLSKSIATWNLVMNQLNEEYQTLKLQQLNVAN